MRIYHATIHGTNVDVVSAACEPRSYIVATRELETVRLTEPMAGVAHEGALLNVCPSWRMTAKEAVRDCLRRYLEDYNSMLRDLGYYHTIITNIRKAINECE